MSTLFGDEIPIEPSPKELQKARVEQAALRIVERFRLGDLPQALAPVFLKTDGSPCDSWSWTNRLLVALNGYNDARTYLDWQRVGRNVKKGEKAFYILEPVKRKGERENAETGEKEQYMFCAGFKPGARFGYEQTEGADIGRENDEHNRQFVEALPLVDVARAWDLKIGTYNGRKGGALGYYKYGTAIAMGVENLSTWAHELVHAADDKLGTLAYFNKSGKVAAEVVAEFGGALLLTLIGKPHDADLGGCYEYLRSWVSANDKSVERACMTLLDRICKCVDLILTTANELAAAPVVLAGAA